MAFQIFFNLFGSFPLLMSSRRVSNIFFSSGGKVGDLVEMLSSDSDEPKVRYSERRLNNFNKQKTKSL